MKRRRLSLVIICIAFVGALLLNACKKDRIPQDDFQNMDSFYDNNKEAEQEYVIDSSGSCPLTCLKGTRICVNASMFSFADGSDITYPFVLKVVELYSIKDMLLWRMPSVSGGNILETSAAIRVRAFKDGNELLLKPGMAYTLEMANMPVINNNMIVYFGNTTDWVQATDTLSTVTATTNYYALTVGSIGFVCAARVHNSSSSNTTLTLSVPGTNTQNIQAYLSFSNFKGLMRITNLASGTVPVGEQVKLVAFGQKQTNDYVLHEQTFAVSANQQIPLSMQVVTLTNLLAALAAL
jgi:hypothetical protein